jgi:hypothetical protein
MLAGGRHAATCKAGSTPQRCSTPWHGASSTAGWPLRCQRPVQPHLLPGMPSFLAADFSYSPSAPLTMPARAAIRRLAQCQPPGRAKQRRLGSPLGPCRGSNLWSARLHAGDPRAGRPDARSGGCRVPLRRRSPPAAAPQRPADLGSPACLGRACTRWAGGPTACRRWGRHVAAYTGKVAAARPVWQLHEH